MASESTIQHNVWAALAMRKVARATLFRTNSGKGWISGGGKVVKRPDGAAVVPFGRPIGLGLVLMNGDTAPGLGDLTGFTSVLITPDMVGKTLPIFTMIETKRSDGGRRTKDQINAIHQVQSCGGIAGFAESESMAHEIIDAWLAQRVPNLV